MLFEAALVIYLSLSIYLFSIHTDIHILGSITLSSNGMLNHKLMRRIIFKALRIFQIFIN